MNEDNLDNIEEESIDNESIEEESIDNESIEEESIDNESIEEEIIYEEEDEEFEEEIDTSSKKGLKKTTILGIIISIVFILIILYLGYMVYNEYFKNDIVSENTETQETTLNNENLNDEDVSVGEDIDENLNILDFDIPEIPEYEDDNLKVELVFDDNLEKEDYTYEVFDKDEDIKEEDEKKDTENIDEVKDKEEQNTNEKEKEDKTENEKEDKTENEIINEIKITSISIDDKTVLVGNKVDLNLTFEPKNANTEIIYTTTDINIADISHPGIATGKKEGSVLVYVSAGDLIDTAIITVTSNEPDVIENTTIDFYNLGISGTPTFVYPKHLDIESISNLDEWKNLAYKIRSNEGDLTFSESSILLKEDGSETLRLRKEDENIWSIRIHNSLNTNIIKSVLKSFCIKISSTSDTLYSTIYEDFELDSFIADRYRSIGDFSIRSEVEGGSTTYYIKDVNYEY